VHFLRLTFRRLIQTPFPPIYLHHFHSLIHLSTLTILPRTTLFSTPSSFLRINKLLSLSAWVAASIMAVHDHSTPHNGLSSFKLSVRRRADRLRQKTGRSSDFKPFTSTSNRLTTFPSAVPHLPKRRISFRRTSTPLSVLQHTLPPPYAALDPQDRLVVTHPSPASCLTPSTLSYGTSVADNVSVRYREELLIPAMSYQRCHTSPSQYGEALRNIPCITTHTAPRKFNLSASPTPTQLRRHNTIPNQYCKAFIPSSNGISQAPQHERYVAHCTSCFKRRNDYEFPKFLPTQNCRHANSTCSYCLHTTIERAVATGGWGSVWCPQCYEKLSIGDMHAFVLRWKCK
jgi:hypothetical protein